MTETGTLLIAGGGTGGHISPGVALYEAFKEKGWRVIYCAATKDSRFPSLSDIDPQDLFLYPVARMSMNPIKMIIFAQGMIRSMFRCWRLIKKYNVMAVTGMGGFASFPALIMARIMKKPIYLCEQNTVPGTVTAFFDQYSKAIFTTFEESSAFLKERERIFCVGNPIRKNVIIQSSKKEAKLAFNLSHARHIILAIGGSQGAKKINELIIGLKRLYPDEFKDIGIIWSTGAASYEEYRRILQEELQGGSVYLSAFIEKVGLAYRSADIAISRSGSGVMMELAAMGLPSIQIPFPFAAKNHQDMNADSFVREGAAIKVLDKEALPEKVGPILLDLLNNERKLSRMAKNATACSRIDAAERIVSKIISDLESTGVSEI